MSTARRYHHAYEDYLRLESESPLKLEYSDGEIFATAGGTPEHGALAMQFVRLISATLPSTCVVFSSDVKIRVVVGTVSVPIIGLADLIANRRASGRSRTSPISRSSSCRSRSREAS